MITFTKSIYIVQNIAYMIVDTTKTPSTLSPNKKKSIKRKKKSKPLFPLFSFHLKMHNPQPLFAEVTVSWSVLSRWLDQSVSSILSSIVAFFKHVLKSWWKQTGVRVKSMCHYQRMWTIKTSFCQSGHWHCWSPKGKYDTNKTFLIDRFDLISIFLFFERHRVDCYLM